MSKKIKIILSSVLAVLLILVLGAFFNLSREMKTMHPTATGRITSQIYAIQDDFVSMYLIKSKTGYIAIDAGMVSKNIAQGLTSLKIQPKEVIAVLLTHTDKDHIGSLDLYPRAKLYVSTYNDKKA
jgi:glyoxylase-like metal-dependent hydrolase (beta-lactamase superfamily II)